MSVRGCRLHWGGVRAAGIAGLVVSGLLMPPGARAATEVVRLQIDGTARGTYLAPPHNPDLGTGFRLYGRGRLRPIGMCAVRGALQGTGFSGQDARPGGSLQFYCPGGSFSLRVVSDVPGAFNDNFAPAHWIESRGSGRYRVAIGTGTVSVQLSDVGTRGYFQLRIATFRS